MSGPVQFGEPTWGAPRRRQPVPSSAVSSPPASEVGPPPAPRDGGRIATAPTDAPRARDDARTTAAPPSRRAADLEES